MHILFKWLTPKMNKIYISLLISLAYFIQGNNAISNGTNVTSIDGFGYQAAVICPKVTCSGVVVSANGVLTTATCINTLSPSDVNVLVGSTQLNQGGTKLTIASIVQHPKFNKETYEANLAILRFTTPLSSTDMSTYGITVIELCTTPVPVKAIGIVSGFGVTEPKSDPPEYLQTVNLTALSPSECSKLKPKTSFKTTFCAGDRTGAKDLCPGDQGAPFVYNGKLCGNYNKGCSCGLAAQSKRPSSSVFNQISIYSSWITSTVNGSS